MTRVELLARAKLTLSLRVLGTRPDGFHQLEALVTSVAAPFDNVELRRTLRPGIRLVMGGPAAAGVVGGPANLATRAVALHGGGRGGLPGPGIRIRLHKQIPPGAGLGGGSADAAAALIGVDRLLGLATAHGALADAAARLGSDVPFCLAGGLAWMRGRGEIIEPLDPIGGPPIVIAVPPFALSTPDVYRAWDEMGGPRSRRACPPPPGLEALLPDGLVNDLEPAAEVVEPRLRPFREALEAVAGRPAVLAGSGSAYFVPLAPSEPDGMLVRWLALQPGATTWTTQPTERGVESVG